ncbi:MAG: Lipopolysaccharide export system ATP-binding protein LptB [Firmicutes bacterium ADurb.Bin506]|jgi:branched-chain amino acid transport system ATP-binding protein|nr:MAG: Lipopolysaccharide export system ATP-binding protein LptB [Firmicutes bacterium ADurb.Bin506]
MKAAPVLVVDNVSKAFGGVRAVDSLCMDLNKGEVLGLIGPNGAGKTTVLNLISSVTRIDSGDIRINGTSTRNLPPHGVARLGIARTFQEIHLFKGLTVLENAKAAGHLSVRYSLFDGLASLPRSRREEAKIEHTCMDILRMFGLHGDAGKDASSLPYGRQKLLEIVKALVTEPSILLLDEPAAGLNTEESNELRDLVKEAQKRFSLSIIVIEHTMEFIASISDRVVVMNFGKKLVEGTWDEVRCDPEVLRCYLGED